MLQDICGFKCNVWEKKHWPLLFWCPTLTISCPSDWRSQLLTEPDSVYLWSWNTALAVMNEVWYISTVPFHVCLFFTGCHAVGSKEDTEVSWGHCRCKTLYLYALYDICLKYLCECFLSIWMKTGISIGQSMQYLIWMYCIYNFGKQLWANWMLGVWTREKNVKAYLHL